MLGGGGHSGAVVALVIGVGAVGNPGVALGGGQRGQPVIEFRLAEITALRGVGNIAVPRQLVGMDDPMIDAELPGCAFGIGQVAGGQGRRDGGNGQSVIAQCPVRRHRQQGAVHAAGICDDDRLHFMQHGFQTGQAVGWGGLCHNG